MSHYYLFWRTAPKVLFIQSYHPLVWIMNQFRRLNQPLIKKVKYVP